MDGRVADARRALGPVGAFLAVDGTRTHVDQQRDAVRRVEAAGYGAVWTNELVGTDALVRAALWLAATERLVVGTCVANMWVRPAPTADAAATQLSQAYPGRFVLGLGVGRPEQAAGVGLTYGSPLALAQDYLQQAPDPPYPRILGANGPRLLEVAGRLADGALPAAVSPDRTAAARATLGEDRLLVVYVPVRETDGLASVTDSVRSHLDAGADHVIIGMSYGADFATAVACVERLAPGIA